MFRLTGNEQAAAAALLVVSLVGLLIVFYRSGSSASTGAQMAFVETHAPPGPEAVTQAGNAPKDPSGPIVVVVHVAGAVQKPGVYRLPFDSRVIDAVKAAGGATGKADLNAINLARKLGDGEQILIPARGETPSVSARGAVKPAVKSKKGGSGSSSRKISSPAEGQVNINTADSHELQRLPGIGPAMAARILEYRKTQGPFRRIEDLREVKGIGPKKLEKLRALVKLY